MVPTTDRQTLSPRTVAAGRTSDGLRVSDLMSEAVWEVRADDDLATVRDLMVDHHIRHVPVVDDEETLVGLVSHRDLLRASLVEQDELPRFLEEAVLEQVKVREVMTGDVEAVAAETPLAEAASIMLENKYGCLPVVAGRRLVGMLTEADFVRLAARSG
jgi:CBS domain-containing membrane protein